MSGGLHFFLFVHLLCNIFPVIGLGKSFIFLHVEYPILKILLFLVQCSHLSWSWTLTSIFREWQWECKKGGHSPLCFQNPMMPLPFANLSCCLMESLYSFFNILRAVLARRFIERVCMHEEEKKAVVVILNYFVLRILMKWWYWLKKQVGCGKIVKVGLRTEHSFCCASLVVLESNTRSVWVLSYKYICANQPLRFSFADFLCAS